MQAGGTLVRSETRRRRRGSYHLPERFDAIANPHASYQLVARFNADGADSHYKPCQTPQLEVYAFAPCRTKLKPAEGGK